MWGTSVFWPHVLILGESEAWIFEKLEIFKTIAVLGLSLELLHGAVSPALIHYYFF